MNKRQIDRRIIRFRRWSRKAYAAFASIGKCVTIGCLRKSVADSSLSKQKNSSAANCSLDQSTSSVDANSNRDHDVPPECEELLSLALQNIKLREIAFGSNHCLQQDIDSNRIWQMTKWSKRRIGHGNFPDNGFPSLCASLFFINKIKRKEQ